MTDHPPLQSSSDRSQAIQSIADLILHDKVRNIVVMTGAGISVSAGIPDFRSKDGIYSQLEKEKWDEPQDAFSLSYFLERPNVFYTFARALYPGKYHPTLTHFFFTLLHQKKLLQRYYTQNVDCLEIMAGLPSSIIVEAHGSFTTASCVKCDKPYSSRWLYDQLQLGVETVPRCSASLASEETNDLSDHADQNAAALANKSNRTQQPFIKAQPTPNNANEIPPKEQRQDIPLIEGVTEETIETKSERAKADAPARHQLTEILEQLRGLKLDKSLPQASKPSGKANTCGGLIKPNIVLFGEDLPPRFYKLFYVDLPKADLLIIAGTSLRVKPFANLVDLVSDDCVRVLVNREPAGVFDSVCFQSEKQHARDKFIQGDSDDVFRELAKRLGW